VAAPGQPFVVLLLAVGTFLTATTEVVVGARTPMTSARRRRPGSD
jgi:hypothetical protein